MFLHLSVILFTRGGGHAWQRGMHGKRGAWQGGEGGGRGVTGEAATAADGTHPTGMHSCIKYIALINSSKVIRYYYQPSHLYTKTFNTKL